MPFISRFLSVILLFLLAFFYLINSVNYLKSILNQKNSQLILENQSLQNQIESRNNRGNNSLNLEIETKTKNREIELINLQKQIDVLSIRKTQLIDNSSITDSPTTNSGITLR